MRCPSCPVVYLAFTFVSFHPRLIRKVSDTGLQPAAGARRHFNVRGALGCATVAGASSSGTRNSKRRIASSRRWLGQPQHAVDRRPADLQRLCDLSAACPVPFPAPGTNAVGFTIAARCTALDTRVDEGPASAQSHFATRHPCRLQPSCHEPRFVSRAARST
jgi:hypothetical protein